MTQTPNEQNPPSSSDAVLTPSSTSPSSTVAKLGSRPSSESVPSNDVSPAAMSEINSPTPSLPYPHSNPRKRSVSDLTPFQSKDDSNASSSRKSDSYDPGSESGRRKRKKTRVFEIPAPSQVRKMNKGALGVIGNGVKLSSIPNIVYQMDKCSPRDSEIELLHRLLFNTPGPVLKRRANIRSFSGFLFETEKQRSRIREKLQRQPLHMVRKVAGLLDVQIKEVKLADLLRNDKRQNDNETLHNIVPLAPQAMSSGSFLNGSIPRHNGIPNPYLYNVGPVPTPSNSVTQTTTTKAGDEAKLLEKGKADRLEMRLKREEAMKATKARAIRDILTFLEKPEIPEGRGSLAQIEREAKRAKKAAEREKAKKVALKKAEARKREEARRKAESDEDGDEDLETEAKTWIQIEVERKAKDLERKSLSKQTAGSNQAKSDATIANGHGR